MKPAAKLPLVPINTTRYPAQMPQNLNDRLVIAISSRALFNLDESHQVYENEGLEAFSAYQVAREEEPLEPGEAFPLVHKLLRLNDRLGEDSQVEVVLLSRNSADTGLRVFNSIQHYDLAINRAAFCGGESPWRYINAFGCQLFLSNEAEDVRYALDCGVAAATLVSAYRHPPVRSAIRRSAGTSHGPTPSTPSRTTSTPSRWTSPAGGPTVASSRDGVNPSKVSPSRARQG